VTFATTTLCVASQVFVAAPVVVVVVVIYFVINWKLLDTPSYYESIYQL
jgi:hypothetical protein